MRWIFCLTVLISAYFIEIKVENPLFSGFFSFTCVFYFRFVARRTLARLSLLSRKNFAQTPLHRASELLRICFSLYPRFYSILNNLAPLFVNSSVLFLVGTVLFEEACNFLLCGRYLFLKFGASFFALYDFFGFS